MSLMLTIDVYAQQLGVHRSSSIASSGVLSNVNRAKSDSSDKLAEAAAAIKELHVASSSYTEQIRPSRVRSTEIVREFAPVREESSGEKSDTGVCSAADDWVDPSGASQDLLSTADMATTMPETVTVLPDRKVAELKVAGRNEIQGGHSAIRTGSRTSAAHVGFVQ